MFKLTTNLNLQCKNFLFFKKNVPLDRRNNLKQFGRREKVMLLREEEEVPHFRLV